MILIYLIFKKSLPRILIDGSLGDDGQTTTNNNANVQ
mgnify:CR=1 FL=1